jgi:DNA-binding transcriptional ArsR family regulator
VSGGEQQQQARPGDGRPKQPDFVRAVNHPLRVQLLAALTNREASPNELSKELGEELGNINYHARKLEKLGMVEIVHERDVRGSTEHFYRATRRPWFTTEEWSRLDPSVRSVASAWTLDRLIEDAGGALNAGTFDKREDRHLSRSPVVLDEQGWRRVNVILDEALLAILEESSASSGRMTESGEEGIPTLIGMLAFEAPSAVKPDDDL